MIKSITKLVPSENASIIKNEKKPTLDVTVRVMTAARIGPAHGVQINPSGTPVKNPDQKPVFDGSCFEAKAGIRFLKN